MSTPVEAPRTISYAIAGAIAVACIGAILALVLTGAAGPNTPATITTVVGFGATAIGTVMGWREGRINGLRLTTVEKQLNGHLRTLIEAALNVPTDIVEAAKGTLTDGTSTESTHSDTSTH